MTEPLVCARQRASQFPLRPYITREFREIATDDQRRELLDCLFAVAAADDRISADEDGQVRQIASELGFDHAEFVSARMAYSDKRSVLRPDGH
jgi:hypothetical protein